MFATLVKTKIQLLSANFKAGQTSILFICSAIFKTDQTFIHQTLSISDNIAHSLKPHAVTWAPKCKYQTTGKYRGSVLKYRVMGKRTQHYYFLTH